MQRPLHAGNDEVAIFVELAEDMSGFKRLLDSGQGTLDELCRRFVRFYRYAKILETIVSGIQSGAIQVPK